MKILGLTGGSGVGKSAAGAEFIACGCGVLDADASYRALCDSCEPMLEEIRSVFGDSCFTNGNLNRKKLGSIVFADPDKLARLNAITHPYIRQAARDTFAVWEAQGKPLGVYDAPVLFEAGMDTLCDATAAVLADRETRIQRIMVRDNITRDYASLRIDAQHSDDWYRERCDFLLVNNGDLSALREQVHTVIHTLLG
ncbi:MAG: dephospho-CoA kinase [Eubacteriales bacterium]|nr:dephospho-CoA kinase [Eubacteriales bacterium]